MFWHYCSFDLSPSPSLCLVIREHKKIFQLQANHLSGTVSSHHSHCSHIVIVVDMLRWHLTTANGGFQVHNNKIPARLVLIDQLCNERRLISRDLGNEVMQPPLGNFPIAIVLSSITLHTHLAINTLLVSHSEFSINVHRHWHFILLTKQLLAWDFVIYRLCLWRFTKIVTNIA